MKKRRIFDSIIKTRHDKNQEEFWADSFVAMINISALLSVRFSRKYSTIWASCLIQNESFNEQKETEISCSFGQALPTYVSYQRRIFKFRIQIVIKWVNSFNWNPVPLRCGEERGDALPNVTFVWYIKNESINVAKIQNTWISTKEH